MELAKEGMVLNVVNWEYEQKVETYKEFCSNYAKKKGTQGQQPAPPAVQHPHRGVKRVAETSPQPSGPAKTLLLESQQPANVQIQFQPVKDLGQAQMMTWNVAATVVLMELRNKQLKKNIQDYEEMFKLIENEGK